MLDYDGCLPVFLELSDGKKSDNVAAKGITLPKGSVVAADRGYLDLPLLWSWTQQEVFFVVRSKEGVRLNVQPRELDRENPKNQNIRADYNCWFAKEDSRAKYPEKLRVVEVYDENTGAYYQQFFLDSIYNFRTVQVALADRDFLQGPQKPL